MARKHSFSLDKADFERKSFKPAPAGKYFVKFNAKETKMDGDNARIVADVSRGEYKGKRFFDHIAAHVGWKIAQLLSALGKTKMLKGSLEDIVKLVKAHKGEVRCVVKIDMWKGTKRNKIVMWLPLEAGTDEDDDLEDTDDEDDEDDDSDDEDEDDDSDDDDADETEDDDDDDDDESDDEDEDDDDDDSDEEDDDDEDEDDDEEDEDEDDDEDEEDDEEDEAPRRRRPASKRAARKQPAARKSSRRRK